MIVEQCGHVMECISLCGIPCLCTLSASAFIEPSLHQLDFFFRNLLDIGHQCPKGGKLLLHELDHTSAMFLTKQIAQLLVVQLMTYTTSESTYTTSELTYYICEFEFL